MDMWERDLHHTFGPKAKVSGTYSQSYQDALLEFIFDQFPVPPELKTCVEFGFNSDDLTGGSGSNVAKLVLEHGWTSWLFDGDRENSTINLFREFLTPENIGQVFDSYGVPRVLGYISIDVDSLDYWLFASLLQTHRPVVFSVEYNANFSFLDAVTIRGENRDPFGGSRKYGASLRALVELGDLQDYECIWVVPFLDAFFVDRAHLKTNSPARRSLRSGLSSRDFERYCSFPCHRPIAARELSGVLSSFVRVKPERLSDDRIEVHEESVSLKDKRIIQALTSNRLRKRILSWWLSPGRLQRLQRKVTSILA